MAGYSLAQLWTGPRRPGQRRVVLRPVTISPVLAGDLYRAAFRDVVEGWRAALPAIEVEYARTLSEMTTDAPADIAIVISAVERDIAGRTLAIRLALKRWADLLERHHRQKWRGAVLAATKVDLATVIGPDGARMALETAIERNVGLVASVSEETRARISAEVFQGLSERRPARVVAKAISEAVGISRRRAFNIASDQASKLGAQLNVERAREAGLTHYQWLSSHKANPRPEHAARDGEVFAYGTPAGDEPGQAVHCGCTARAVLGE